MPRRTGIMSNLTKGQCKYSYEDLMRIRKEGAIEFANEITTRQEESDLKSVLGRSGIMPLHQACTVENYVVSNHEQSIALDFAKQYIRCFNDKECTGFIFSGGTGTGKNHLASAICNSLMLRGKSCLVVTVSELMLNMRKCYSNNAKYSEDEFIKQLINFDLLVLDEIGLQKGSDHEKIILNQVIDQRIGHLKPVGVLTNLDHPSVKAVLGERIFDRLKSNNSQWVPFNWGSYRK
mgnify:CR=1 FL=1